MTKPYDFSGLAALTICEALMLALNDRKVLPESDIIGVLDDAASTHENGTGSDEEMEAHRAAAKIIRMIVAGKNSVRRP